MNSLMIIKTLPRHALGGLCSLMCLAASLEAQNAVYPKIEASFNLTGISTNPVVLFDFSQTDVEPDITYLIEVAGSLTSGIWNSGPSYTSQTVTDTGNGTETVTATDLIPIGSASAHYLRVQILH
jgi:hypothetical protein